MSIKGLNARSSVTRGRYQLVTPGHRPRAVVVPCSLGLPLEAMRYPFLEILPSNPKIYPCMIVAYMQDYFPDYCCLFVIFIQCRHLIPALNAWAVGPDTRPYARLPHSFIGMVAWMSSQLNVALFCKLRGLLMCLAYLLTCFSRMFYNQALADHRSTGAGIKCLYYSVHIG